MKKSVILSIGIIYVLAIVIVGFLGVALKVEREIVYVSKIELIKEADINYTESDGSEYNYSVKLQKGTTDFVIKCRAYPENADNAKLDFTSIQALEGKITITNHNDGSATIHFNDSCSPIIVVSSTDRHPAVELKIRLENKKTGSDIF